MERTQIFKKTKKLFFLLLFTSLGLSVLAGLLLTYGWHRHSTFVQEAAAQCNALEPSDAKCLLMSYDFRDFHEVELRKDGKFHYYCADGIFFVEVKPCYEGYLIEWTVRSR